ncbi:MAG: amidase family protein, partial [Ilumatobacteraceae bacterium]
MSEPRELAAGRTVLDIVEGEGAGTRPAVSVLEEHLGRIDEREGEIHAFNLVLADEARTRAAEIDAAVAAGDEPGPLAGVP